MKKIILSLVAFLLLNTAFSQDDEETKPKKEKQKKEWKQEIYVGLHFGTSLVGILNKGMNESNDSILGFYKYTGKSKPVIGFTIDAFVIKKVTMGLNYSFQVLNMDIDNWKYLNNNFDTLYSYDNSAKLTRSYLGGKLLYHYVNNSRADIYSGFRAGLISWKMKLGTPNSDLQSQIYSDKIYYNRPAIGFIPFGCRIKIKDKFSITTEVTFGAPNFISAGLTYQISEIKKNK